MSSVFLWTDEQREFRAVLRRLLDSRAPLTRNRVVAEAGERHDPAVWQTLAADLDPQALRHGPGARAGADGGRDAGPRIGRVTGTARSRRLARCGLAGCCFAYHSERSVTGAAVAAVRHRVVDEGTERS